MSTTIATPYTYRAPQFLHSQTGERMPNDGGWQTRHEAAVRLPNATEAPYLNLLGAWLDYANAHRTRHGAGIGEDTYAGPYWATMASSLIYLLSMDIGRLDAGTIDTLIRNVLAAEGLDPEGERA